MSLIWTQKVQKIPANKIYGQTKVTEILPVRENYDISRKIIAIVIDKKKKSFKYE